jgi:threonine/homoserine/homoserine lactone efflux protein
VPDLTTYLTFIAAALAMQLAPGPDMALVIGRGIGQGRQVAIWTAIGTTAGAGVIQIPLVTFGVASLVEASPVLFTVIRLVGAVYLIWLGARALWRAGSQAMQPQQASNTTALAAFRDGMISNLTNPKPLMFMLAFLPQFVDPAHGSVTTQLLILSATQKLTGTLVMVSCALVSGSLGGWLSGHPRVVAWQERFTALVLFGLGARLLFADDARAIR